MNILDLYLKQGKEIKLNIGCRNKPLPTYINIDIDPSNNLADIIDDGLILKDFRDKSCDVIEAVHTLEHLTYNQVVHALYLWWTKLRNGGILRLSVPDSFKCASLLNLTNDASLVQSMFLGSQLNEWDKHKILFTKELLTRYLKETAICGFKEIKEWNYWDTFPHNYCDSYAASVWPHMRKKFKCDNGRIIDLGGICLSINLEAVK